MLWVCKFPVVKRSPIAMLAQRSNLNVKTVGWLNRWETPAAFWLSLMVWEAIVGAEWLPN